MLVEYCHAPPAWFANYSNGPKYCPCNTSEARSLSPLVVSVKESFEELWMSSKGGLLKALIGLLKIAQSSFGCIIEDP